jgi:hypothetical protein
MTPASGDVGSIRDHVLYCSEELALKRSANSAYYLRAVCALGLLFQAALPARSTESDTKPTIVLRVAPISELKEDLKYFAKLAGQGERASAMEGMLNAMPAEQGLMGLDVKRPFGFYATIGHESLETGAVALLPVVDEKTILSMLQMFNVKSEKGDDDIYTITAQAMPMRIPIYLRFTGGYAYVTAQNKAALAKDHLLDPEKVLAAGQKNAVYLMIRLDQLPEAARQLALGNIEAKLQEAAAEARNEEGNKKAELELRSQVLKTLGKSVAEIIKGGGELEAILDFDRKSDEIVAQVRFAGKPGTELRKDIQELGSEKSLFSELGDAGSAMRLVLHATLPEEVRNAIGPAMDEKLDEELGKEKDPHKKEIAKKLLEALKPTLKSGDFDLGINIQGPSSDHHYGLVIGIKVKEGKALDQAIRDIVKDLPADAQEKVKERIHWNAETIDGVTVHRIDADPNDKDARRKFGDKPFYMAVRDDALFLAGGEGGQEMLKAALAARPGVAPELRIDVAVGRFAPFTADNDKKREKIQKAAAQAFAGSSEADHLRVTIAGGDALTVRVSVKGPVLKFGQSLHGVHMNVNVDGDKKHKKPKPDGDDDGN